MHVCNACVLCNMNTRLTLLIRANNKNSKRCMTARSAILVQCANGTLHTAELGFFPLQSRAHRLHEVIGTQHDTATYGSYILLHRTNNKNPWANDILPISFYGVNISPTVRD